MNDASGRRDDFKILKGFLSPFQEFVALAVALKLLFGIHEEGAIRSEFIDLNRVIDHQIDRDERVDFLRIAARTLHSGSHGGQIDHARHASEVLQDDARYLEWH